MPVPQWVANPEKILPPWLGAKVLQITKSGCLCIGSIQLPRHSTTRMFELVGEALQGAFEHLYTSSE